MAKIEDSKLSGSSILFPLRTASSGLPIIPASTVLRKLAPMQRRNQCLSEGVNLARPQMGDGALDLVRALPVHIQRVARQNSRTKLQTQ